jgi:predicted Zn-dependent protease
MKQMLVVLLLAAPAFAGGQGLLEFRHDLAFSPIEVNSLGATAYGARLRTLRLAGELDPDPALKVRLQGILARLLRAAAYERPASARLSWEVHSCGGCDENASAMPGGKLLVSADFIARHGLGEDEIAYLLAHEVAHVLAEHTREFADAARYFLDNGLARSYRDIQHELDDSLPAMLHLRVVNEQQELEADYMGFLLGARAGYEPQAMLSLLQKLGSDDRGLLRAHPSSRRRLEQARVMLESARRVYGAGRMP